MSLATNQLRARAKRFLLPGAVAAALLFAVTALWNHRGVNAAGNYAAPLDNNSVSALTSLDSAMEAVASHVTPAVVNVAVTSRSTEAQTDDNQLQQLPPSSGASSVSKCRRCPRASRSSTESVVASSFRPTATSSRTTTW